MENQTLQVIIWLFGGSGGYLVNQTINYTAKPAAITFKVGEAGKSGTGIHWDNLSTTSCTGGRRGVQGGTKGGNGGSNCSYAGVAYQAIAGGGRGRFYRDIKFFKQHDF